MAHVTTQPTQTAAGAPLDVALMDVGLRQNDDDHEARIQSLESGSAGGGGGGSDLASYGEILGDKNKFADDGILWWRKFSPNESTLLNGTLPETFDIEGGSKNDRFFFQEDNLAHALTDWRDTNDNVVYDSTYNGSCLVLLKGGKVSFKVKAGENFFGIGIYGWSTSSDNLEITVDGATPTSLGLTSEDGAAAANAFSTVLTSGFVQNGVFYFGLDGREHVVTLHNNDSASKEFFLDATWVGYRKDNYSINHDLQVQNGKAKISGVTVPYDGANLSFTPSRGCGRTSAVVCDDGGTLTVLDGYEPYMTQARAEEELEFSAGVTSIPVKSAERAEDNFIGLAMFPNGNSHLFSWGSKTTTTVQANSLDNIIWNSSPSTDFTPLDGFSVGFASGTGDMNIIGYASAPVLVTVANNKLDFKVVIGGATTTHVATINNGAYASDLVSICDEIVRAMQASKPLNQGTYICEYDEDGGKYNIGVSSHEVTELQLPFSSGVSFAASIHGTLGYPDTDLTGVLGYGSTTERRHKAARVLQADSAFMTANDPRIKYSDTDDNTDNTIKKDAEGRMGFGHVRYFHAAAKQGIFIYPDEDTVGISMHFVMHYVGQMLRVQIDGGTPLYLAMTEATISNNREMDRAQVLSAMVTYPRGSKVISVVMEDESYFTLDSSSMTCIFMGSRQYYTRPALEELTTAQKILRSYDIAPVTHYCTLYGHTNTGLYSPTATDNINSITESGSWISSFTTTAWNRWDRQTSSLNDYVDVNFTLQGTGYLFMRTDHDTGRAQKASIFVSASAINESTDRVQNVSLAVQTAGNEWYDTDISTPILPAGTYNVRFKVDVWASLLTNYGFGVVDEIEPEPHKYTQTDITGAGQNVAFPVNVIKRGIYKDGTSRVPSHLHRTGYREGKMPVGNYGKVAHATVTYDDYNETGTVRQLSNSYYAAKTTSTTILDEFKFFELMKSCTMQMSLWDYGIANTHTGLVTSFVNSKQCPNSFALTSAVKGGTGPYVTRFGENRFWFKKFYISCVFSAGTTFTCTDTRGIRADGQTVRLYDGTNYGYAIIQSFIDNTSFTVNAIPAGVTAASVTTLFFFGFQSIIFKNGETKLMPCHAWEFEPLDIKASRHMVRQYPATKLETKSVVFRYIVDGADLYYPVHSDGTEGNFQTSTIELLARDNTASFWEFPPSLKNCSITAGTMDVKITSTKMVANNLDNNEVF